MSESNLDLAIRQTVIAGGAAGDHTVTGITTRDVLKSVIHFAGDGTNLTDPEDLTDEFSISDDDEINNTGGTATTNGFLLILYLSAGNGGDLNRS